MKRYNFRFVGYNKSGERIVEDIRSDVPDDIRSELEYLQ